MKVLDQAHGNNWSLFRGDCCDVIQGIPDASIDYSIFSPPFAELYAYSDNDRDMGNSRNYSQFFDHFGYLVEQLHRVIAPGRLISVHCIDIPAMKERDGYIGLKDFPGDIIRLFQRCGFVYHSRHIIWKDPLIEAVRTKAIGLAHKQLCKDSAMSRAGLPDYLITFRHPGENKSPIAHTDGLNRFFGTDETTERGIKYSHNTWRKYASPVWMDINQTNTLNRAAGRDERDEKHICPLQLDVIARGLELWSAEGDRVLSPFAGIGSEIYQAVLMGRRGVGIELKESYFKAAINNLERAEKKTKESTLFDSIDSESPDDIEVDF